MPRFEIVSAWWGEKIGARRVLTRIVIWWSAFTMATAGAWNYSSLLVVRFLFGAGEAGAWPNAALAFSRWIPLRERGRVQGFFFAAAHVSGGITPLLVAWLLTFLPWRGIFVVCGFLGVVWAAAWYRWFRDEPRDHPGVNQAELVLIESERLLGGHKHHGKAALARARLFPECLVPLPRLSLQQLRLLFRHDLAAHLSGREPRL